MFAIYKKEMRSYLTSPVGYVFLAVFYAISGYYFFATSLAGNTTDLSYLFSNLFTYIIFLVPMLTMRLFSEERRHKTEQVLFTAPVRFTSVVGGKFLACLSIFAAGLAVTLVYLLVILVFRQPDIAVFFGHFIGTLLLGGSLCAIGMFLSALTESQVIAVVSGLAAGVFLLVVDSFSTAFSNPVLSSILSGISFFERYQDFAAGILNLSDLVFFLSVILLFLFLTVRHLERRRIS